MQSKMLKAVVNAALIAGTLLAAGVSSAQNVDVWLQAQSYDKEIPDGDGGTIPVKMWGYAACDTDWTNCEVTPDSPGPQINLTTANALTVHLKNTLPNVPVSIMIPGQAGGGDPTPMGDRVSSFTHEAGPGGTALYEWSSLRAGTFLYQSGSLPSLEVPMGLYGALVVHDATSGLPYADMTAAPDAEGALLFSEIDYIQNQRVDNAAATLAPTVDCTPLADFAADPSVVGYPCAVDYSPWMFLVNGQPAADLPAVATGTTALLRLLNAGQRSHTPSITNVEMALLAEDGNRYPGTMKSQSEVLLAAGKTIDVLITASTTDATQALFDRMPTFSNENLPNGGALGAWVIGTGGGGGTIDPSLAADDGPYIVTEDTPYNSVESVLLNDSAGMSNPTVVSGPSNGSVNLDSASGNFTYTPNADYSGPDSFTYSASLGGISHLATVTLDVSFENDGPVAADDGPYTNSIGTVIQVAAAGILGNDADADGDGLTASIDTAPANGTVMCDTTSLPGVCTDGSFTYTPNAGFTGDDSFTYLATDDAAATSGATVSLHVNPVAGIALNVVDSFGNPLAEYRWLVQENRTFLNNPGAPAPLSEQHAQNFHRSYMPMVASGAGAADFANVALDPAKHYYVSVLPNDGGSGTGHTIGGNSIAPGTTAVTVITNNQEIPTAQVSVFVFEDTSPTNGVNDPGEPGLGGFQIVLEDAGGRYGISGGTMSQDAFGNPLTNALPCAPPATPGVIISCDDGSVLVKNLPPGKYGVIGVPRQDGQTWSQTSTIEGTKVVDVWLKAGEPPYFTEFGATGPHVFLGYVNPNALPLPAPEGSNSVTGHVTLVHDPRPPQTAGNVDSGNYVGLSHTRAWVGVNSAAGGGPNILTVQADADGNFQLDNLPDGTHQLVIWDTYLDQIIAYRTLILPDEAGDIGNVPVNHWFTRVEHNVFLDENENGIRDPGEQPLPEQNINLRWRDGTVNQAFPTDSEGFVPFDQVFPFFAYQLWEVDYTRFKPTGMTAVVDGGGDVTSPALGDFQGLLNPQLQLACTQEDVDNEWNGCTSVGAAYANPYQRTETGSTVLLEAFQGFPGQTSIIDWGKVPYQPGENGGISGIVSYASTRGEENPRLTVMDPWEPGIPGVTVRLYREVSRSDGSKGLALVQEVQTDSWDASPPEGCPGEALPGSGPFVDNTLGGDYTRCYDGFRNWNQVRPGVFDGGYAFNDIPPGRYVVEAVPPPGYEIYKEEDVNVGFGDAFGDTVYAPVAVLLPGGAMLLALPDAAMVADAMAAEPGLAQPPCVGEDHLVPPYLALFPSEMVEAPFAGAYRPMCDRKEVILSDQGQAAADFHMLTLTPVAAQFSGLVTDDIASDFNPASAMFGEKFGPAYIPFSIRDFNGNEVYRGYSDAFGHYNGMMPSTFTANVPIPSGYSPAMMATCLNDPGDGPALDPYVSPAYGTFCYTLQFMPGTTTYVDTPLLPTAAFAAGFNSPDCSAPEGTPVIAEVDAQGAGFGPLVATNGTLVIRSMGLLAEVPNPAYEGPTGTGLFGQPTITRDLSFGVSGAGGVGQGTVTINGTPLAIISWSPDTIRAQAPAAPVTGQLVVTRANGSRSVNAVTVTVSNTETPIRVNPGQSIQAAIDSATAGQLIMVAPGVFDELLVIDKPVRLQGSGAATIINGVKRPAEKFDAWNVRVGELISSGAIDLLPGQPNNPPFFGVGPLATEQGGAITVLAKNDGSFSSNPSRIDGFQITGGEGGGAIFVNGWAHNLEISNNYVTNNLGNLHGGIRVGRPYLPLAGDGPFNFNNGVRIHNNAVVRNGAIGNTGAGGGISLATGTNNYQVTDNFVCGNFSQGRGAGIGHLGLSRNGLIARNTVLFNQSVNAGLIYSGGGIFVGGEDPIAPATLSLGTGNVTIDSNRVQGNAAGAGHGGGIAAHFVNGRDVEIFPASGRYLLNVINNIVVNNLAGYSGGGLSLLDAVNARVVNNTIANNDSTAQVGTLVNAAGGSTPQPAGISAQQHSLALAAALGTPGAYTDPLLQNNIVWHNRAFWFDGNVLQPELSQASVGECVATTNYWDLGVLGAAGASLHPMYSVLTDATGYDGSNIAGNPGFLSGYCNGGRVLSTPPGPMQAQAATGEGGNFIDVRFGPLTQSWPAGSSPWNYHIGAGSVALNNANAAVAPAVDIDNQARPQGPGVDRGADELWVPGSVAFTSASFGTLGGGTLNFGTIGGNGSQPSTVTISVTGNAVTFGTLTVTNSQGGGFSKGADSCSGQTVAAGGTCTVTVNFQFNGNGTKTGTLAVPGNMQGSPRTLNLTGI